MAFYLENETVSYGDFEVLSNISLDIEKGEKVALLGKSGSGKSTLLKTLYEYNQDKASYIPQELGLVNNLSVFHNVYMSRLDNYSTFYNIRNLLFPVKKEVEEISIILDKLQLEDKLTKKASDLSGGQRQRTAIARAIFDDKTTLLADEPISALDEYLSGKVVNVLINKFDTVVCALHNVQVAVENFDRVIGLKDGKILVDKECSQLNDEDREKLYYVCE